jgi:PIN domain
VGPMKNNNQPLIELYTVLLTDNIRLIPIDEAILKLAAQLRSSTSLKTPDAIHAATARSVVQIMNEHLLNGILHLLESRIPTETGKTDDWVECVSTMGIMATDSVPRRNFGCGCRCTKW